MYRELKRAQFAQVRGRHFNNRVPNVGMHTLRTGTGPQFRPRTASLCVCARAQHEYIYREKEKLAHTFTHATDLGGLGFRHATDLGGGGNSFNTSFERL